jgi:excisionase family DNA binding protein
MGEQRSATEAPDLLTIKEVAARVRLSYVGTLGLVHRGLLPAAKVGKAYRVRAADLEVLVTPAGQGGR